MFHSKIRQFFIGFLVILLTITMGSSIIKPGLDVQAASIAVEVKGVKMYNIIVHCTISGFSNVNEKGAMIREKGSANWFKVSTSTNVIPYTISFYNLKANTEYEIKGYCLYGSNNTFYESPSAVLQKTLIPPVTEIRSINPDTTSVYLQVSLNPTVYEYMYGGVKLYLAAGNQYLGQYNIGSKTNYFKNISYTIDSLKSDTDYILTPFAINHYGEIYYFDHVPFKTDKLFIINPTIKPISVIPLPTLTPTPMPTPTLAPSPTQSATPTLSPALTVSPTSVETTMSDTEQTTSAEITALITVLSETSATSTIYTTTHNDFQQTDTDGNNQFLIILLVIVVIALAAAVILLLIKTRRHS